MEQTVYLNGKLLPLNRANISPLDYGFLYGYGLFETMRAYNGRVFRLNRHLKRLADSADKLGIPATKLDLKKAVTSVLETNNLSNARVRIAVSIGEGGMTPNMGQCRQPTVLVMAESYKPHPESVYNAGYRAIISSIDRYSRSPLAVIKSANYLENMLAKREAAAAGADEAIRINENSFITEASMSNVFLITGKILMTPAPESGLLPGITREAVMELASRMGIITIERQISVAELLQSKEAFLTNSLIEIMPLTEVDGKRIASGKPGPVTKKLRAKYKRLVTEETGAA